MQWREGNAALVRGSRRIAGVHVCVHWAVSRQMGWDCTLSFPLHVSWPSNGGRVNLPPPQRMQPEEERDSASLTGSPWARDERKDVLFEEKSK